MISQAMRRKRRNLVHPSVRCFLKSVEGREREGDARGEHEPDGYEAAAPGPPCERHPGAKVLGKERIQGVAVHHLKRRHEAKQIHEQNPRKVALDRMRRVRRSCLGHRGGLREVCSASQLSFTPTQRREMLPSLRILRSPRRESCP